MKYIFNNSIVLSLLILLPCEISAQDKGIFKSFSKVSFPEKIWAITHPFVVKKAWHISKEALRITEKVKKDSTLDSDSDGGQVDAFRHIFWMASLSQKIKSKKVRKLGIAHEKGNFRDFKNGRIEETNLPDSISTEMDLRNNELGIKIGTTHINVSHEQLIAIVTKNILEGNGWVIFKNKNGEFQDSSGNVLKKESYLKKWKNSKYLVRSNKNRK